MNYFGRSVKVPTRHNLTFILFNVSITICAAPDQSSVRDVEVRVGLSNACIMA